jgi:hypothetical protein
MTTAKKNMYIYSILFFLIIVAFLAIIFVDYGPYVAFYYFFDDNDNSDAIIRIYKSKKGIPEEIQINTRKAVLDHIKHKSLVGAVVEKGAVGADLNIQHLVEGRAMTNDVSRLSGTATTATTSTNQPASH